VAGRDSQDVLQTRIVIKSWLINHRRDVPPPKSARNVSDLILGIFLGLVPNTTLKLASIFQREMRIPCETWRIVIR
jgi:hypothetical protein